MAKLRIIYGDLRDETGEASALERDGVLIVIIPGRDRIYGFDRYAFRDYGKSYILTGWDDEAEFWRVHWWDRPSGEWKRKQRLARAPRGSIVFEGVAVDLDVFQAAIKLSEGY